MPEPVERKAADLLLCAHRTRKLIESVPFALEDQTQALAVQALVAEGLGRRNGWKVGLDSVGHPVFAPLFTELSHVSPVFLSRRTFNRFLLECELAIVFKSPLPPRATPYDRHEVFAAAGHIHAAIEIVDTRFCAWPNVSPLWMLADGLSHGGFILGDGVALTDPRMLEHAEYHLNITGGSPQKGHQKVDQQVARAHPQPDPWETMTQLANTLSKGGQGVLAGDVVTTGTFSGATVLEIGQHADVSFKDIGHCSLFLQD